MLRSLVPDWSGGTLSGQVTDILIGVHCILLNMFNNTVLFLIFRALTVERVAHILLICLPATSQIIVKTEPEICNGIASSTYIQGHGYTISRRSPDPRGRCDDMVSAGRCHHRRFDSTWNQNMDLSQASQR